MSPLKKHSVVTLDIEDLAYGGAGVAKPDGFVVFVERTVPGDRVRARIIKKTKNYAHAVLEEIEHPSERRIDPPCPLFDHCGGCTWQELAYDDQLQWKHKQVVETLTRLGGLRDLPEVGAMIPSPDIWNYRNKMEFSFGLGEDGETIIGFHIPGRYDRIFAVDRCLIHPEPLDALLAALTDYARDHDLSAYHQRDHTGFLRHAVMRHSRTTGGVVLILITAEGELPEPESLAARLKEACPSLQAMIWGVNSGVADVADLTEERFRWGDPVLVERINGLTFKISPTAFFQTNTSAAERLYQVVVEMAQLGERDRVFDAYCGGGAIGLHCAPKVDHVVGIDISRASIWDARANARDNGIANATFLVGPLQETLPLARRSTGGYFSRVVIDPPRGGMDKKSLAMLIDLQAPVFVYVSCNPATLARDLQTISDGGYRVEAIQPIDMFPHTYHIEVVVRLRRV